MRSGASKFHRPEPNPLSFREYVTLTKLLRYFFILQAQDGGVQFTGTPQCGPPAHTGFRKVHVHTVKPPIKDTLKEDKPPNKGQAESTHVCTL